MSSSRKTSVTVGALFIVATAANVSATALEQSVLGGADDLNRVAQHVTRLAFAGLLELVAAGTSAGVAIALYPVVVRWDVAPALGAVALRTLEAGMYAVGAVCMLTLPTLAPPPTGPRPADLAALQSFGDALLGVRQEAILAGVFAFAAGALLYYWVLYRARLVPRWLSAWGIGAEGLLLVACLEALFSYRPVTSYTVLALPIAAQEMVLAFWLVFRGFDTQAFDAAPSVVRA